MTGVQTCALPISAQIHLTSNKRQRTKKLRATHSHQNLRPIAFPSSLIKKNLKLFDNNIKSTVPNFSVSLSEVVVLPLTHSLPKFNNTQLLFKSLSIHSSIHFQQHQQKKPKPKPTNLSIIKYQLA